MDRSKRLKLLLVDLSGRLPARLRRWLFDLASFGFFKIWRPLRRFLPAQILRRMPFTSEYFGPPRGLWVTTEECCRAIPGASFTGLRPAREIVCENSPAVVGGLVLEVFAEHHRTESPSTFVGLVPEARVFGDCGAVIAPDDQLLADVSFEIGLRNFHHSVFTQFHLPRSRRVPGVSAVVAGLGRLNYFHWMFDVLPRFELLREAGYRWDAIDHFFVGEFGASFQKEALQIFGIGMEKIISCGPATHFRCEQLLIPSMPGHSGHPPRWVCDFLRATFLQPAREPSRGRRLYISRTGARFRRVLNEDEVIATLMREGFEVVKLEMLSVVEQAALFAGAAVVVAPHGAGLTNLVFCRPGTAVVEIFAPRSVLAPYWTLSAQVGLRYAYLLGRADGAVVDGNFFAMFEDIHVDCAKLRETLLLCLSLPSPA